MIPTSTSPIVAANEAYLREAYRPLTADEMHATEIRQARSELHQAKRVADAADLVKAAADNRVQDARRALWALGTDPDEEDS